MSLSKTVILISPIEPTQQQKSAMPDLGASRFFVGFLSNFSGEEALENRVFGLLLGETKGLEL